MEAFSEDFACLSFVYAEKAFSVLYTHSALAEILYPTVEVDSLPNRCEDGGVCRVHQDGGRLREGKLLLQLLCGCIVVGT